MVHRGGNGPSKVGTFSDKNGRFLFVLPVAITPGLGMSVNFLASSISAIHVLKYNRQGYSETRKLHR